jgi:toxin-antitoxin system PIN domain toxin
MKLADTNVWLALVISKHLFHDAAQDWLDTETLDRNIVFCRCTLQSFLRLITTAAMLKPYGALPFNNREAWELYERLLADRRISIVNEPPGLEAQWKALATRETASPKVWMDAYLAAFAIAGAHQFVTTDHAFTQYTGLDLLVLPVKAKASRPDSGSQNES